MLTAFGQDSATVVCNQFLYEQASFPSCHASTIVETQQGNLLCAYFGGTYEGRDDVSIWVSIKPQGADQWEKPILVDDGNINGELTPCWNPVLFEMPDGELWVFYKIAKTIQTWKGYYKKSRDGGKTWSERIALPENFLGPIKNKPILLGNKLLCGSSTEVGGWRFHVEILDLQTGQWEYIGPITSTTAIKTDDNQPHPIDCIQPSFLQLKDGHLQVLMRTHNARLATSFSSDQGKTWTDVVLTDLPNNNAGTDALTLRDGRHVLIYNPTATQPYKEFGPRTPLCLAISKDGVHWQHLITLEDAPESTGEYSYPAIIEGRDGTLHCTYTWRRERIVYKQVKIPRSLARDLFLFRDASWDRERPTRWDRPSATSGTTPSGWPTTFLS